MVAKWFLLCGYLLEQIAAFFVSVEPFKLLASGKLFKLLARHAGLLSGSLAVIILYYMYPYITIGIPHKHVPMYSSIFYMYTYIQLWYNKGGKAGVENAHK